MSNVALNLADLTDHLDFNSQCEDEKRRIKDLDTVVGLSGRLFLCVRRVGERWGGGVKDVINLADLPEQLDDFKVLIFEMVLGDGCLFVLRGGVTLWTG